MPQKRIAIVGDSFIKRLSRDSLALAVLNLNDISAFSYHHKLVDGTSLQSIARLHEHGIVVHPHSDLLVLHLRGNDLSSSLVDPAVLAEQCILAIGMALQHNAIPCAVILPILHRLDRGLSHPLCIYRLQRIRLQFPDREAHYNSRVDVFNNTIRQLVSERIREGSINIRFGKIKGMNTRDLCADGVHVKPSSMLRYTKAILQATIEGLHCLIGQYMYSLSIN